MSVRWSCSQSVCTSGDVIITLLGLFACHAPILPSPDDVGARRPRRGGGGGGGGGGRAGEGGGGGGGGG
ncbi:MAG: hypothetical protein F4Y30_12860, partial [Chloroflexi bacterium]|nr:hypothetical protein [Chloroflexota bacterium]